MKTAIHISGKPVAKAEIKGSAVYPQVHGMMYVYETENGALVITEVQGLPDEGLFCSQPVFGMHIHSGASCTGTNADPFANAGAHWNPKACLHPHHAGDLPPLFGNHGYAFSAVITDRFTASSAIGKTVIIHTSSDDFQTQPAGNSGIRMACGEITAFRLGRS